jgi:hypothetical protein
VAYAFLKCATTAPRGFPAPGRRRDGLRTERLCGSSLLLGVTGQEPRIWWQRRENEPKMTTNVEEFGGLTSSST